MNINFQQSFQLQHNITGMYLGYNTKSIGDSYRYQVDLVHISGENTTFKLHPSRKYQKDSNGSAFYDEPVSITEVSNLADMTYYLHCKDEQVVKKKMLDEKYSNMIGNKLKKGKTSLCTDINPTKQRKMVSSTILAYQTPSRQFL